MLRLYYSLGADIVNKKAHYSLEGYNNPLGISEYELSKLFPKEFKGTLPSIEDIEKELGD